MESICVDPGIVETQSVHMFSGMGIELSDSELGIELVKLQTGLHKNRNAHPKLAKQNHQIFIFYFFPLLFPPPFPPSLSPLPFIVLGVAEITSILWFHHGFII